MVAGFARYHKYGLGSALRAGSRRAVMGVVRANVAHVRLPELLALRDSLDALLLDMRLAAEVRAYAHMAEQVATVCRQNEGWIKATQNTRARPGRQA